MNDPVPVGTQTDVERIRATMNSGLDRLDERLGRPRVRRAGPGRRPRS